MPSLVIAAFFSTDLASRPVWAPGDPVRQLSISVDWLSCAEQTLWRCSTRRYRSGQLAAYMSPRFSPATSC